MVLNYRATNYTGWPLPACKQLLEYSAKIQFFLELSNFFTENLLLINVIFSPNPSFLEGLPTLFCRLWKKC